MVGPFAPGLANINQPDGDLASGMGTLVRKTR